MIPLDPDWRTITNALYVRYGSSYTKLLDALGPHVDHSTLSKLRSGKVKRPKWPTGAALLNLYGQTPASRSSAGSCDAAPAPSRR